MTYLNGTRPSAGGSRPRLYSSQRAGTFGLLVGLLVALVVGGALLVHAYRQDVTELTGTVVAVTEEQRTQMCGKTPCMRTVYPTEVDLGSRVVVLERGERADRGSSLVVYQSGDDVLDYAPTSATNVMLIAMMAVLAGVLPGLGAALLADRRR